MTIPLPPVQYPFDSWVNNDCPFWIFATEGLSLALLGLLLGAAFDALGIRARNALVKRKAMSQGAARALTASLQTVVSMLVLYITWSAARTRAFAEHWQNTIQGLFFPAMFFGVQSNIYEAAQAMYKYSGVP